MFSTGAYDVETVADEGKAPGLGEAPDGLFYARIAVWNTYSLRLA